MSADNEVSILKSPKPGCPGEFNFRIKILSWNQAEMLYEGCPNIEDENGRIIFPKYYNSENAIKLFSENLDGEIVDNENSAIEIAEKIEDKNVIEYGTNIYEIDTPF